MRVLFVNGNRSAAYGGVERWMIEAARGLGARRHVCALLGRPETAWLRAAEKQGVPVRAEIRGAWIQRVLRVRAAMRDFRPDVVVAKAKKAARMAAFGRSTGSGGRAVLFFGATHELEADRAFDRLTWRALDAGIVVATAAAEWYVERGFGPREKFHVLWKGVEASDFDRAAGRAAATRTALGLEAADLAIGTVGRLAWQKGLDDLLAAARLVCARVPRARFFVIGGGRDAAQVAAAAAAPGLDGAVTLLGQRDDVPELLAAMDIIVQSSRREAMAQATLEAMAAARPVVSTATVGADEAIEDGVSGLIVPVRDPEALADRLVGLAVDPARRLALGQAARRRVAEHFTTEHMLDRCEAILRAIVAAR
ncbi:MAG: glycosyltransferase family 4 protein [Deltaproteobacteria bacterium]|nr:MAG: glycosyltransferase family 4 protein [Deltaproteobacteria bacterium]